MTIFEEVLDLVRKRRKYTNRYAVEIVKQVVKGINHKFKLVKRSIFGLRNFENFQLGS